MTTTVLLAEDCEMNRNLARAILSRLGCEVTLACDGVEACRVASERRFDVIFMDCEMPGMDGLEATRQIRRREIEAGSPRAVILALTANARASEREVCLAAGMDDVVGKPFRREHLRDALHRYAPEAVP